MSLLSAHLEQISASCQGIDSLPFPQPGIFTNALLASPDITSLIRDTEPHERALFSVPPPPRPGTATAASGDAAAALSSTKRRQTVFTVSSGEVAASAAAAVGASAAPQPRRHTAVAAVLGPHLHESLRRGAAAGAKGDVDLEVLLSGAEKLCGVYEPPGARERIAAQRRRYRQQADTLAYYEKKVAEQAERLERMGRGKGSRQFEDEDDEDDGQAEEEKEDVDDDDEEDDEDDPDEILTEDDLRREEEEVKELDRKKRELQERIRTMDKDLGGLLRM